jgi:hypothetical protein
MQEPHDMELQPEHLDLATCLKEMEGAIAGLWYPSESDALVSLVIYADPLPDTAALGEKLAAGSDRFQPQSAAEFFRPVLNNPYWASAQGGHLAQKYARLRDVLQTHLHDIQSFRVGTVNVTVYLLGRHPSGCYLGVCTHVVET